MVLGWFRAPPPGLGQVRECVVDPGEGSTGLVGRGPGDQDGEAAWPVEEEFEGGLASCPEPWPEGPRIGMRRSLRFYEMPA